MKPKMNRLLSFLIAAALTLPLFATGGAFAAGSIYVNDDKSVLSGDLNSAYVIGGNGEVSLAGDIYAVTGSGEVVKVGQGDASPGTDTPEAPLSGTVSIKTDTVKIGLYYKTASFDTAVSTATLSNATGSGFSFGYYNSARVFQEQGRTADKQVTIQPNTAGSGVVVTGVSGNKILSSAGSGASALAIVPISTGKAQTKLSNNGYTYYGGFVFDRYNGNSKLTIINVLNIEDYVKGVLPYEMVSSWPLEALKAGAVAARNYVQANYNKYANFGFDIINTANDQVYRGTNLANTSTNAACEATANQYLTHNGKIVNAYYYAANGGASENSENVWIAALGYCKGKPDPFEGVIDFYCKSWSKTFTTAEITAKLTATGLSTVSSIVTSNTANGNVYSVTITDVNGKSFTYSRENCLTFLTRLGFPYTSMRFAVSYNQGADQYTVSGGGAGHNVGMSQWGAYAMASVYGKNYREILGFYYTDVKISTGVQ